MVLVYEAQAGERQVNAQTKNRVVAICVPFLEQSNLDTKRHKHESRDYRRPLVGAVVQSNILDHSENPGIDAQAETSGLRVATYLLRTPR